MAESGDSAEVAGTGTDGSGPALCRPLPDLAATEALARALAPLLAPGDVICLRGELGSGKTTFARCLLAALGVAEEVPSPTFTLLLTYDTRSGPVWHFDLYRLSIPDEAFELGIEDAFASAISLIEWPERLGPLLPADRLDIALDFAARDDERTATLRAHGGARRRFAALWR